jgi:hypothetical protein
VSYSLWRTAQTSKRQNRVWYLVTSCFHAQTSRCWVQVPKVSCLAPKQVRWQLIQRKSHEFAAGKIVKAEAKFPLMHVIAKSSTRRRAHSHIKALLEAAKLKNVTRQRSQVRWSAAKLQLNKTFLDCDKNYTRIPYVYHNQIKYSQNYFKWSKLQQPSKIFCRWTRKFQKLN